MSVVPTSEPSRFRAGHTLRWLTCLPDYPAPDWQLSYALYSKDALYTLIATDYGDSRHAIHITPDVTATYLAGLYDWVASVLHHATGDKYQIASGVITIDPDLTTITTLDGRSHARRVLDSLNAIIENRASTGDLDIISNAFGELTIARNPELLLKTRDKYAALVQRENSAGQSIKMYFR